MWVANYPLHLQPVLTTYVAVSQVQISLASERVVELRQELNYRRRHHEEVSIDESTEQVIDSALHLSQSDNSTFIAMFS